MMAKEDNDYLAMLKSNWFLIVAVVSIVASWVTMNNRQNNLQDNFITHCAAGEINNNELKLVQLEVRELKSDTKYLKESMDRNENLLREILGKVKE